MDRRHQEWLAGGLRERPDYRHRRSGEAGQRPRLPEGGAGMNVVKKPLAELRRPERNVRMHTDKQLKEFRRSVEMFGQIRPIVIDEGGVILAGNGLFETLLAMGHAEADCYVAVSYTHLDVYKRQLLVRCNLITEDFMARLTQQELALGDFSLGRYAWEFEQMTQLIASIPARGAQGLWYWDAGV